MKKLLKVTSILGVVVLIFCNVSLNKKENNENVNLFSLGQITWAQSEETQCLGNYIFESGKYRNHLKKCYKDANGPDIFEGYVDECLSGGSGCQPTFCSEQSGCYTTSI